MSETKNGDMFYRTEREGNSYSVVARENYPCDLVFCEGEYIGSMTIEEPPNPGVIATPAGTDIERWLSHGRAFDFLIEYHNS